MTVIQLHLWALAARLRGAGREEETPLWETHFCVFCQRLFQLHFRLKAYLTEQFAFRHMARLCRVLRITYFTVGAKMRTDSRRLPRPPATPPSRWWGLRLNHREGIANYKHHNIEVSLPKDAGLL